MRKSLEQIDYSRPVDEWREGVIAIVEACCDGAAQVSAMETAIWYDGLRERVLGSEMGSVASSGRSPKGTEMSVRSYIEDALHGDVEGFIRQCCDRLAWEITSASGKCVVRNAREDPGSPRYARVPQGEKTCDFCIMLASRGPIYHTAESAGAFTKFHYHCDCRVVPVWDSTEIVTDDGGVVRRGGTQYEGYDPDAYFEQYLDMMLNPNTAQRFERGAERAKERHGRPSVSSWREAYDEGLATIAPGGARQYLLDSTSFDDLCERMKVINREIAYYGLNEQRLKNLQDVARMMRDKFLGKEQT